MIFQISFTRQSSTEGFGLGNLRIQMQDAHFDLFLKDIDISKYELQGHIHPRAVGQQRKHKLSGITHLNFNHTNVDQRENASFMFSMY